MPKTNLKQALSLLKHKSILTHKKTPRRMFFLFNKFKNYIPIPFGIAGAAWALSSFGSSATTASVVNNRAETDAAF